METYIKFDELLRTEKVNQFLITRYNNRNSGNNYNVNFEIKFDDNGENSIIDVIPTNPQGERGYLKYTSNENEKNQEGLPLTKNDRYSFPEVNSSRIERQILDKNQRGEKEIQPPTPINIDAPEIFLNKYSTDLMKTDNFFNLVAKDMGTTANILLIKNNMLYLANVGDSMAVLFKNGQALKLNYEHKTTLQSEYSRVTKSGAKIINNRIQGRLNLTRAIGNYSKYIKSL
jgi:hypothetical protein